MTEPISGDPFRPASEPFSAAPPSSPAPVVPPPVRSRGGGGMLVNVLLGVALVVAIGGVAFAVGRATAPAVAATRTGFGGNGQGGAFGPGASGAPGGGFAGNGGLGGGGLSIEGTVTAVGAGSITLQLTGGQTVTISTDGQTTYHQRETATASAVTSGSTVIVQLQNIGRGAFGGGGQGGGATASGAPNRTLGPATSVTVAPAGS